MNGLRRGGLRGSPLFHAETDPALHAGRAFVSAAAEAVASFDDADTPLAAGPPFLTVAEPALFLLAFALRALGGAIGNADALHALGFGRGLVLGGVEGGVRRHQPGRASQPG